MAVLAERQLQLATAGPAAVLIDMLQAVQEQALQGKEILAAKQAARQTQAAAAVGRVLQAALILQAIMVRQEVQEPRGQMVSLTQVAEEALGTAVLVAQAVRAAGAQAADLIVQAQREQLIRVAEAAGLPQRREMLQVLLAALVDQAL